MHLKPEKTGEGRSSHGRNSFNLGIGKKEINHIERQGEKKNGHKLQHQGLEPCHGQQQGEFVTEQFVAFKNGTGSQPDIDGKRHEDKQSQVIGNLASHRTANGYIPNGVHRLFNVAEDKDDTEENTGDTYCPKGRKIRSLHIIEQFIDGRVEMLGQSLRLLLCGRLAVACRLLDGTCAVECCHVAIDHLSEFVTASHPLHHRCAQGENGDQGKHYGEGEGCRPEGKFVFIELLCGDQANSTKCMENPVVARFVRMLLVGPGNKV